MWQVQISEEWDTTKPMSVRGDDDNFGGKTQKLHYDSSRNVGRERRATELI
jgi:hypothetical protein